jgi:hypothetical protein
MKRIFLIIILVNHLASFSQTNNCDCIEKLLSPYINSTGSLDYNKLKPKIIGIHHYVKIIKDSANFWYFVTPENGSETTKVIKLKKAPHLIMVNIKFNNLDSIPVYEEPKNESKIVKYLYPQKWALHPFTKQQGGEQNDHLFSSCKNGWVKINNPSGKNDTNKYFATGWIKKEHFLTNLTALKK